MVIKYKNYIGAVLNINHISGDLFDFRIQDKENIIINFKTKMNQIKIIKCEGNREILSEIKDW